MIFPFRFRQWTWLAIFLSLSSVSWAGIEDISQGLAEVPAAGTPRRPKIALVLSGGGARGLAHVGVLKVLEEYRIPIDLVIGTSMGAIMGGLYAAGISPLEMEQIITRVDWKDLFNDYPSDQKLSFRSKGNRQNMARFEMGIKKGQLQMSSGIIAGQKLGFLLKRLTLHTAGTRDFDKLPLAFRAVATDLENGEMVVLGSGNLGEAMRASMSIPGVFSPVELGGRLLVDGGVIKNFPIDIARDLGAEIIIAVYAGASLYSRERLNSVIGISMQSVNISSMERYREQVARLDDRDVLIFTSLKDVTVADFNLAERIIDKGEQAARLAGQALGEHTISPGEYRRFLERQRKKKPDPIRVEFINISGANRVRPQRVLARIGTKVGEELDLDTLEEDLTRIYAIGDFERVDFHIAEQGGRKGLSIDLKEKNWGPNYLMFGLNFREDFEGDSHYQFLTNLRMTQLNGWGAEWETELQVGNSLGLVSSFHQPLGWGEHLFLAPSLNVYRIARDFYQEEVLLGRYWIEGIVGGLDLGFTLGTLAEARFGLGASRERAAPIYKGSSPISASTEVGWIGSLEVDQLDNPRFPQRGVYSRISLVLAEEYLGSDISYRYLEGILIGFFSPWPRHTLGFFLQGGSNFLREGVAEFSLGGFLALSGYRWRQLSGPHYGLFDLIYYFKLLDIWAGWADALYLGASFETGRVWQDRRQFDLKTLRYCGSLFIGLDTILGPLYLAYGFGQGARYGRAYLFLGATF